MAIEPVALAMGTVTQFTAGFREDGQAVRQRRAAIENGPEFVGLLAGQLRQPLQYLDLCGFELLRFHVFSPSVVCLMSKTAVAPGSSL
ncbi:hypothetical protein [Pseudoduganella chitinolytica]|uniref:Uncharacterized protein n=1 Tax=Pseudoduganella chitinolytica TaxID=34070 RepID=A0ABY8BAG7_9BURK|nr:hypothetical protein [Pseudoduganella chitinolytica]WEF32711.1 hypothetical protein PX653_25425 [Pseudoduganella chitinolytica]